VFVPNWGNGGVAFYLRAGMGTKSAYAAIKSQIRALDPALPVYEMKTLGGQLDETLLTERLIALLSAGFGLLATLLATIGLYGVMAFVVARRTKEVGVRVALGAQPAAVVWLVMREVVLLIAIGLAIGIPAAVAVVRHSGERPVGGRHQHDAACSCGCHGGSDSRAPRQPDRSDSGAALRVVRFVSRVEFGWLNAGRPQIHIGLPAMVNFVIYRVKDERNPGAVPLANGLFRLRKTMWRDGRPDGVQPGCRFIPKSE
jgi:hypothetical protein